MTAHERAELEMLREFYRAWLGLHGTSRTPGSRRKLEACAQLLVDRHHELQNLASIGKNDHPLIAVEAANEAEPVDG